MEDITAEAMDILMAHAPVWAASMAGRTKVFISDETPTAYVTGSNNRFKIVINPSMRPSLAFVLMHEVAHIFRNDITSMKKNEHLATKINIAADCIINDSLKKMGIKPKKAVEEIGCWGKDLYGFDCSEKSINDLMKVEPKESENAPSAPGNVTPSGQPYEEEQAGEGAGEGGEEEGTKGVGDDFSGHIGLGGGDVHNDPKNLARSVVSYAKRMFFEAGFKSKNMSTRYDWRRNRSAFAGRHDVVVPRTTVGEYGHNTEGPLVNLVLDTSGSMDQSWVKAATVIASEIGASGLDYDLWLTPSRRKARNPKKLLAALCDSKYNVEEYLEPERKTYFGRLEDRIKPYPSRAIPLNRSIGSGANELREIAYFDTEDPVVWIYVGDYLSTMDYELFLDKNFLHVPMVSKGSAGGDRWSKVVFDTMKAKSLPRWFYTV